MTPMTPTAGTGQAFETAIKTLPAIIEQASKSPLGIFALMIVLISALGYIFFKSAGPKVKVPIFLVMFAGVTAYGVAISRAASTVPPTDVYRVRVIILGSQHIPVDDGRVWSSMGGEAARIQGGWQFVIPVSSRPASGKLTVYAAIDAAFLSGQADVQLAADYSPSVTVQLMNTRSASVRGIVVDAQNMAIAGAIGGQFQPCNRFREVRRPCVEMRDAALFQKVRREITEDGVHLGHGVGNRRRCCEDDAAAGQLADVAGLHEHVEGAVAVAVREAGDAAHLCRVEEILVQVCLIDEELIDTEFLKGQRVVLVFAVGALLQFGHQTLFGFFQFLDDPPVVTAVRFSFENRVFELLHLFVDEAIKESVGDGQKLERAVRDDDGVVVTGRNARHGTLAIAVGEMILGGDEQLGLRIKLEKGSAPLFDEVIGHHQHRFLRQTHAAQFHRGGRHSPGLSCADDVGEFRTAALQDAPDSVFLVGRQIVVAQKFSRHARQRQVRAVECAQAQIVEAVVIVAGQARRARAVLPHPFAEAVFQLLLLFPRGDGLLLVDRARSIGLFVIGGRGATVQGMLDEAGCLKALRAVGRGIADTRLRAVIDVYGPCRNCVGVGNAHVGGRNVEQLGHKIPDVGCGNPRRTQARLDVARLKVGRLHGFQGRDVAMVGGVERGGVAGDREFRPDIAAQIAIGGLPIPALGIAVNERA